MKQHEIQGKARKKRVPRTTDSQHGKPVADNVLNREFTAHQPNKKWASDITYIQTNEGWLYLAAVIDLYSRKIIGWATADHLRADLVVEATSNALHGRRPQKGLLYHSDRGKQYVSKDFKTLLKAHKVDLSMSRKGDCWDNAVIESFWGTLKSDLQGPLANKPTTRFLSTSKCSTTVSGYTRRWVICPPRRSKQSTTPLNYSETRARQNGERSLFNSLTVEGDTFVPHKASVMSSTRRTLTPAKYISTSDSSTDDSRRRYRSMICVSNGSFRNRGTLSMTSPALVCSFRG